MFPRVINAEAQSRGITSSIIMIARLSHRGLLIPAALVLAVSICFAIGSYAFFEHIKLVDARADQGETYDAGSSMADLVPAIHRTFTVRNRGPKPIKLVHKVCTCTCTTTKLNPEFIQPGEVATFGMSIRMPGGYSGKTSVRCELTFDDNRTRTYAIAYESFPRIMSERSQLDLGTYSPRDRSASETSPDPPTLTTWLELFCPARDRLPFLKSVSAPDELEVIATEDKDQPSVASGLRRRRYAIQIRPRPHLMSSVAAGACARTLSFLADDGSSTAMTVLWRCLERYTVAPTRAYFGTVEVGSSGKVCRVLIGTSSDKPLRIASIQSDSELVTAEVETGGPDRARSPTFCAVKLELAVPSRVEGSALSGTIHMVVADAESTTVSVPWSAFVRRQAEDDAGEKGGRP